MIFNRRDGSQIDFQLNQPGNGSLSVQLTGDFMVYKEFDELSGAEVYEILKARSAVFMIEQSIFYLDMDDVDYRSIHIYEQGEDGTVCSYLRLFSSDKGDSIARIGRVLTRDRGVGNGRKLLQAAERYAGEAGYKAIELDAQKQTVLFYQKCGYEIVSEEFIEAGIPHIKMRKSTAEPSR